MQILLAYISLYLLLVNLLAFTLYAIDKRKARKQRWRIAESVLLWMAFLGGSLGAYIAMAVFHHKTQHKKFTICVPLFLLLHICAVVGLLYYC